MFETLRERWLRVKAVRPDPFPEWSFWHFAWDVLDEMLGELFPPRLPRVTQRQLRESFDYEYRRGRQGEDPVPGRTVGARIARIQARKDTQNA